MGTSDITVSSLVAVPRVQGNKLAWAVTDPWPKDMTYSLGAVEVWGSTTNDRSTATKVGEGITDFIHAGLAEEVTWYYWIKARNKVGVGSYGAWYPVSATAGVSGKPIGMAGGAFTLSNGKIVATVAANALTIAIMTAAGNDPSASDPIFVAYPDSSGAYNTRSITSATSLVISSGSTLGTSNSIPFRIWVNLFDDGGTLRIGVKNCLNSGSNIFFSLPENAIASTTAEGGAGAADNSSVHYTGSALTSKRYRVVGYLDWNSGLATAGTWSAAPDVIHLQATGDPLPGSIIQTYRNANNVWANDVTGAAVIPYDDTIPQDTEGMSPTTAALVPFSQINYAVIDVEVQASCSVAGVITLSLVKQGSSNTIASKAEYLAVADKPITLTLHHVVQFSSASNQSFPSRIGCESGTIAINGTSAARKLGGTLYAHQTMSELMV